MYSLSSGENTLKLFFFSSKNCLARELLGGFYFEQKIQFNCLKYYAICVYFRHPQNTILFFKHNKYMALKT